MIRSIIRSLFFLGLFCTSASAQQMADPEFDPQVIRPAFSSCCSAILFDEAHHNFHTASGNYKPFVELMAADGHSVHTNTEPFSCCTLAPYRILVISNALGDAKMDSRQAGVAAFTEFECTQVAERVAGGGSLLLIADHPPFGSAARNLAGKFGVKMSNRLTIDSANHDPDGPSSLVFSQTNGLLGAHTIIAGRFENEKISRVITFTGQSLVGPAGSVQLLALSNDAVDVIEREDGDLQESARGRAQGLAFRYGRGRVVVLGEAAVLTAQIYKGESGEVESRFGMNRKDCDDRQFALNVMRWLAGILD